MTQQGWLSKCFKAFGFVYFAFNCIIFAVICVLAAHTSGKYLQFSPGWIYLIFPGIGMLSGYWIRIGKYGWARSLVIVSSLLCSTGFLFISFVAVPQMNQMEKKGFQKWQKIQLTENTKQMFVGVYSEDIKIVKEQLDKGVDINAINETEETALHVTQNKDIARMLIDRGANIHAKDDSGMTPIFNKEIEIAGMLLDAGADINARSEKGNTPFIWYTYSGHLEGLQFLVSIGAEVNICNVDNQNAMDIAKHFHPHTDVEKYIQTLNIRKCNE